MPKPEQQARGRIDAALALAGWVVQDHDALNLSAGRGVVVREFPLGKGFGTADYLLFVDGKATGVIEAKKEGETLTGVELQAERYSAGIPAYVQAPVRPLPFLYQSTGTVTRFTNRLDPDPRSREVFHFHQPPTLAGWLAPPIPVAGPAVALDEAQYPHTLRGRLRQMPPLHSEGLWPPQREAIANLERSLAHGHPRSLVQMATGSGKTFTAISAIYRQIKFGGAARVLFLVDRGNLGRQTKAEFDRFVSPDDGRKFTELYNVQHLTTNRVEPSARVVITTIQRLYSMLRGDEDLPEDLDEASSFLTLANLTREPVPVAYNPRVPIEAFDVVYTDECHRSIYHLWRQCLDYFDAFLIGLTATPSKQTIGFFNRNLVMEYGHEQAVADGVNVDFDVYRIKTEITERGATIPPGFYVDRRDRLTRRLRWEELDDELTYGANQLDRDVVAQDQIRTVVRTLRDRLFTEVFPGRSHVPKTLIFAKDDSHAEDIVDIVREEFGKGNDFCQKITYKTGTAKITERFTNALGVAEERVTYKADGAKPEELLSSFRNDYYPRVVVTVDMIATGTDIKPLEIVMFMRAVKSRTFFEQMKGRGVRVVDVDTLRRVTPDAVGGKTHFVIVDAVGACETELSETKPLNRNPSVRFDDLLNQVAYGNRNPDVLSSLASRLARLDRQLTPADRAALAETAGGLTVAQIAADLVAALDPDRQIAEARAAAGLLGDEEPSAEHIAEARAVLLEQAAAPLATNPALRHQLETIKTRFEQTIDTVSLDTLLEAGHSADARERAARTVESFERFIEDNRDEISALQLLYSVPYARRPRPAELRALAAAISAPPRSWTTETLWRAYETLDRSKVRGAGERVLADLVSLVRFAVRETEELAPYADGVNERFARWLAEQELRGRTFTPEQRRWLDHIRDHIAGNLAITADSLDEVPFSQHGGLGGAWRVFGDDLDALLDELNEVLTA